MRIRKNNAKISQQLLLYSAAAKPINLVINQQQPHIVCQLNQSPWDVITDFSPPSSPPPPPPPSSQVVDVNKIGASSMDSIPVLEEGGEFDDSGRKLEHEDADEAEQQPSTILCCKTDGRSWQCRKEAAAGSSMCTHHLSLTKSYSGTSRTHPVASKKHNIASTPTPTPTPRRTHPRPKKASAGSSSNPYEFYYYSGFGPRWGKKRGGVISHDNNNGSEEIAKNYVEINEQEMDNQRSTLLSSQNNIINGDDFDYVEYEDEEEEEEINGKKRARKPIKARSLKSLM